MGASVTRYDYEWSYTDEPHATRRELILKKYPQIKKLMGVDPRFKWVVVAMVLVQFFSFYLLQNITSFWILFLIAYCFGGVLNHSLTLAIHEISHNQAFGSNKPLHNRLFGIFANLPIGFPISITFKKYHLEHHRFQGDEVFDTDIPSGFEARYVCTTFRKFIWLLLQPVFYGFRPMIVHPKKPTLLEFVNLVVQILFDLIVARLFGWNMVAYMIGSSLVSMGLHPVAGHFISEHYIMFESNRNKIVNKAMALKQVMSMDEKELAKCEFINGVYAHNGVFLVPETASYYGPLNWLTFNVGYHVEHHDFPSISGFQLPKVREIAPEYYDSLCYHTSWVNVLYRYIFDPNIGPYSRVRRQTHLKNGNCKSE